MASELRVNRIIPVNGVPTNGGGGVIQTVQSVVTSNSSGTGGTPASVMTASITPTRIDSKVLVLADFNVGSSNNYNITARLYRGTGGSGTQIYFGDASGNRPRVTRTITTYDGTSSNYMQIPVQIIYLDSPSTTSQITYDLRLAAYQTQQWSFNRSIINQNDTANGEYDGQNASSMTLMEISG
tara:strand:+ start:238 stop:786 length:549 start_codon:yes stop_codon:yes gene_type:complete